MRARNLQDDPSGNHLEVGTVTPETTSPLLNVRLFQIMSEMILNIAGLVKAEFQKAPDSRLSRCRTDRVDEGAPLRLDFRVGWQTREIDQTLCFIHRRDSVAAALAAHVNLLYDDSIAKQDLGDTIG